MTVEELNSYSRLVRQISGTRPAMLGSSGNVAAHLSKIARDANLHSTLVHQVSGGFDPRIMFGATENNVREHRQMRELLEGSVGSVARAAEFGLDMGAMRSAMGYLDSPSLKATMGALNEAALGLGRTLIDNANGRLAGDIAARMQESFIPAGLAEFRLPVESVIARLSYVDINRIANNSFALDAFSRSMAMSNAMALATRVDRSLIEASRAFAAAQLPELGALSNYREFLDASGLWLRRWPRVKLLTAAEKRRRVRERLKRYAEPSHVRHAKSLVHRYELVLREMIDAAMAFVYGEAWKEDRLPFCGCNKLLGRAKASGGNPLEYADYAHYRLIMIHPEHHEKVFSTAFECPHALANLIDDAGRLRARSHHAREFSPADLLDLRLVWRTLETGLVALIDDYEIEY